MADEYELSERSSPLDSRFPRVEPRAAVLEIDRLPASPARGVEVPTAPAQANPATPRASVPGYARIDQVSAAANPAKCLSPEFDTPASLPPAHPSAMPAKAAPAPLTRWDVKTDRILRELAAKQGLALDSPAIQPFRVRAAPSFAHAGAGGGAGSGLGGIGAPKMNKSAALRMGMKWEDTKAAKMAASSALPTERLDGGAPKEERVRAANHEV